MKKLTALDVAEAVDVALNALAWEMRRTTDRKFPVTEEQNLALRLLNKIKSNPRVMGTIKKALNDGN